MTLFINSILIEVFLEVVKKRNRKEGLFYKESIVSMLV